MQRDKQHAMKVVERVFEHRIRQQIEMFDMRVNVVGCQRCSEARLGD